MQYWKRHPPPHIALELIGSVLGLKRKDEASLIVRPGPGDLKQLVATVRGTQ